MLKRHWHLVAVLCLGVAMPAWSKGWDPLGYTLRVNAFGLSDAFPGSIGSGPDHGFEPGIEAGSGRRVSKTAKLGLTASAGGRVQQEFTRANYGWLGAGASLRRPRTTYTLDGAWTPKRDKFPTDSEEGGEFASTALTGGVRQTLGKRARLRVEGTVDREKFVPQLALRDSRGREIDVGLTLTPAPGLDLKIETTLARDATASPKYSKDTRWVGAGAVWSDPFWRADLGARSGVRRYSNAILGDSNFQRRDQWIELRLRVSRALRPGLTAALGANLTDLTSSRTDRAFLAQTFTLGFEWTGGGK